MNIRLLVVSQKQECWNVNLVVRTRGINVQHQLSRSFPNYLISLVKQAGFLRVRDES